MSPAPDPADIERTILALLERRGEERTICPSEAARALAGDDGFRELMDDVRATAARMAERGEIEATQRGRVVDAVEARGPIRLRRR
jgi:hypothetical protein